LIVLKEEVNLWKWYNSR